MMMKNKLVFFVFVSLILVSWLSLSVPSSHSAVKSCSNKADISRAKISSEKILGSFTGDVFSFLQLDERYYLVTAGRNSGGKLVLLDATTGENTEITIGISNLRDLFKLVKAPNFSMETPDFYFSALIRGDSTTPRLGRQSMEPAMQNILPSGLAVYKATLSLKLGELQNVKPIYKQNTFLVSGSNYGGALAFSNDRKYLYISTGDEGSYDLVQQSDSEVGKVLRLNLNGSIPKDNPLFNAKVAGKNYAYGFRNSYGMVQLSTGELMGIDHGPFGGDELNVIRKSGNYGWPITSEGVHYSGEFIPSIVSRTIRPGLYWSDAVAPSAISVIPKELFPSLQDDILVSTLKGKSIFRIHKYCGGSFKIVEKMSFDFRIRDFSLTPSGHLLTLSDADPSALTLWSIRY